MEHAEDAPDPIHAPSANRVGWERVLDPFLYAPTVVEADRHLDYLMREFVTPLITSTLARELRRGPVRNRSRIWTDDETFRDIQAGVEGDLVLRLRHLRTQSTSGHLSTRPIADFRGYVRTASRHACADYLRERRPGRHALDTALRVALDTAPDLALWRVEIRMDLYEWRCGSPAQQEAGQPPLSLRNAPALQTQLWQKLRDEKGTRASALRQIFDLVQAPLLYTDLLDFLAALWNVEAPYRAAALGSSSLRVQNLAATTEDPANVAQRLGTLQEIWLQLRPLSPKQKAVLLLRLPPLEGRNFLEEFVRFGIVEEAQIAEAIGLTITELRYQYSLLPLEDVEIAALLQVPEKAVRRIRQDARRRLERQRSSQS